MSGVITLDIAVLALALSQVGQWVGIYLNNKNAKRALEANLSKQAEEAKLPMCVAAQDMVKEHISLLATHSAEIANVRAEMKTLRIENQQAHSEICERLDRVLENWRAAK